MIRGINGVFVLFAMSVCLVHECDAGILGSINISTTNLSGNNPLPAGANLCLNAPNYAIPGFYVQAPGHIDLPSVPATYSNAIVHYQWDVPSLFVVITGAYWDGTTYIWTYGYWWQGQWQGWMYVFGSGPTNIDGWHEIFLDLGP